MKPPDVSAGLRSGRRPQVLGGVSSPRTPSISAIKQLGRGSLASFPTGKGAHEADIGCRKGVGLAQLPQSNVLRRPFADAADRPQSLYRLIETAAGVEEMRVGDCGRSHGGKR